MQFLHVLIFKLRFTYEVSPVFLLMEEVLLKKMQSIVGWSDDEGDGIFCPGKYNTSEHQSIKSMKLNSSMFPPGGSMSNLYSILLARYHFYPEVKTSGMRALPHLVLFTSEHVRTISDWATCWLCTEYCRHYLCNQILASVNCVFSRFVTFSFFCRWGLFLSDLDRFQPRLRLHCVIVLKVAPGLKTTYAGSPSHLGLWGIFTGSQTGQNEDFLIQTSSDSTNNTVITCNNMIITRRIQLLLSNTQLVTYEVTPCPVNWDFSILWSKVLLKCVQYSWKLSKGL